jgi:hypothetical protein
MTADDLLELLHERPFKPLRPHLADDQVREISRPNMALVAKDTVLIGTTVAARLAPRGANVFVPDFDHREGGTNRAR